MAVTEVQLVHEELQTELTLTKTHKACVYSNPGTLSISVEDVETPSPGPDEVLVNLTHTGVCFADFAVMTNKWPSLPHPTPKGQVGGHEGVGIVVGLGSNVRTRKIGDRVGIKWTSRSCTVCMACLQGQDGVCYDQKISGYSHPGTYQQYVTGPADQVTPIPEGLASDVAAPLLCAGVRVYSAIKRANMEAGQWLAIWGAGGGPGHLAVQLAARGFGYRVIGIDSPAKKDLVMECGAEHFLDSTIDPNEVMTQTRALTEGLGAHSIIVADNSSEAYNSSISLLRVGGTLVCVGMPTSSPTPIQGAAPVSMIFGLLTVTSVAIGSRKDAADVLKMAARGIVKTKVEIRKMEDLERTFKEMLSGQMQGRVVLDLR